MKPLSEPEILQGQSVAIRVIRYSAQALRITQRPLAVNDFPADRSWFGDVVIGERLPAGRRRAKVSLAGECLQVTSPDGGLLFQERKPARMFPDGQVSLHFGLQPGEGLYGFGEWFNAFRRTRGRLKLSIQESPAILQGRQTYSTLPLYFSDRNYAVFALNSHAAEVDISPREEEISLKFAGPPADYLLIHGQNPKDVLSEYTRLTGRPPLLPRWAYGLWVTGYPQESQERTINLVHEHRTRQVPLDGVILDYHWEERFHNFNWRRSLFPEPQQFIDRLRAMGVHLGLIFTPFVNHTNLILQKSLLNLLVRNLPEGTEQDDERDLTGYNEGHSQGFFADDDATWWFGKGGMVDFTNPEAAAWWQSKLEPLYRSGVSFFKNDDGEYLPLRARSANGMDGREYHNLYGFYYGRAIFEGMEGLDDRRGLIYARSVWAGSQRYPALFLGDQVPSFKNLRRTLRAGMNMSQMGFAYWTADVFGLNGRTTPETHMRYAQWALLNPIARYFRRPEKIDPTREPWSHTPQVLESFKTHVELRYRLLPYYHLLGWEAWKTGIPLMRPMWIEFPGDERLLALDDQVMLGNALMLCPVVERGARSREVVFPAGNWYDFWTGEKHAGGRSIRVSAPIERLPIFVRGASLLPLGPVMQFIPEGHRFTSLELHAHPPFDSSLVFPEDEPGSRAYQKGGFAVNRYTCSSAGQEITIHLEKAIGQSHLTPAERTMRLVLHDLDPIRTVEIDGKPARNWEYNPDRREGIMELVQRTDLDQSIIFSLV